MKLQLLLFCLCVESFRYSEKCPSLFLAGNKQPVQAPNEKQKSFNKIKISVPQRSWGEKFRNKIHKLHCFRPKSRDNGGKINPTLWCFSSRCNDSPNDLLSRDCVGLELERYSWVSATDICKAVKNWIRRKYLSMCFLNFGVCCWGCSTKSERRSQCHSLLYTHPFPKKISVIANAHRQKLYLFNKFIQQERFTVSSSVNCLFQ